MSLIGHYKDHFSQENLQYESDTALFGPLILSTHQGYKQHKPFVNLRSICAFIVPQ